MTILENYRSSTEYREILRILQKATTNQENILWQSHALEKTVIPVQYIEIDFIAREVLIYFTASMPNFQYTGSWVIAEVFLKFLNSAKIKILYISLFLNLLRLKNCVTNLDIRSR